MAEASDVYGILHQNLVDAGCSEKGIAVCMDYAQKGHRVLITIPALYL